jgi:hypothetical protein
VGLQPCSIISPERTATLHQPTDRLPGLAERTSLGRIDQDLRIKHVEYTLGATDLTHISAIVMRDQNTIIRAPESDSQKDFERITELSPAQRARIQHAVDRYAAA